MSNIYSAEVLGRSVHLVLDELAQFSWADCIVNPTDTNFFNERGIAYTIREAAGQEWQEGQEVFIQQNGCIRPGQAVLNGAGKLNDLGLRYIINVVPPNCSIPNQSQNRKQLLLSAVTECLKAVDSVDMASIAFPPLITERMHYPCDEWAADMIQGLSSYLKMNPGSCIERVYLVAHPDDTRDAMAFQAALNREIFAHQEHGDSGQGFRPAESVDQTISVPSGGDHIWADNKQKPKSSLFIGKATQPANQSCSTPFSFQPNSYFSKSNAAPELEEFPVAMPTCDKMWSQANVSDNMPYVGNATNNAPREGPIMTGNSSANNDASSFPMNCSRPKPSKARSRYGYGHSPILGPGPCSPPGGFPPRREKVASVKAIQSFDHSCLCANMKDAGLKEKPNLGPNLTSLSNAFRPSAYRPNKQQTEGNQMSMPKAVTQKPIIQKKNGLEGPLVNQPISQSGMQGQPSPYSQQQAKAGCKNCWKPGKPANTTQSNNMIDTGILGLQDIQDTKPIPMAASNNMQHCVYQWTGTPMYQPWQQDNGPYY